MTQSEKRRKLNGDITTELCGLSGLSQVMNTSENEALFALADLLGPAVNRLLGLLEESDNIDSFTIPEDAIEDSTKTAEETRAEIYDKFAIELHGLKGLAMAMEESGSEITLALSDLLGPAVNRLLNLIEELEQAS